MMRFENKVIVVTGGSSGIGAAVTQLLSKEGGIVFVLDIQPPQFTNNKNTFFYMCDVAKASQITATFDKILSRYEKIDHLFTNAGIHLVGSVEETLEDDLDRVTEINFKGTFHAIKAVLPCMKNHREGSIVVMGSDQVIIGKSGNAVYGTTKAAVAQLTKNVAIDYSSFNIRINCVCPGTIDTPLTRNAVAYRSKITNTDSSEIFKAMESKIPLGRIGTAEEVARVILFLLSKDASYMTGSTVMIDGGFTAQ